MSEITVIKYARSFFLKIFYRNVQRIKVTHVRFYYNFYDYNLLYFIKIIKYKKIFKNFIDFFYAQEDILSDIFHSYNQTSQKRDMFKRLLLFEHFKTI